MAAQVFRAEEFESTPNYLKLCTNKAHRGPVSKDRVRAQRTNTLSAAANKIMVASDFTIRPVAVATSTEGEESTTKPGFQARSYVVSEASTEDAKMSAKYAIAFMCAWDQIYGSSGTAEYEAKAADIVKMQAKTYSELGINPCSGKRPNLTADQKAVYDAAVGPYGFDYFEYHLAFKFSGSKRTIRSRTYRSLEPIDVDAMLHRLKKAAEAFLESVDIEVKSTN